MTAFFFLMATEIRSTKHGIRNILCFIYSNFEIVSDFGFRISDF